MKYQSGYLNGNTETDPFPVKTGRNTIQALASCVAPAGQIAQAQPKAPCRCRPMLS